MVLVLNNFVGSLPASTYRLTNLKEILLRKYTSFLPFDFELWILELTHSIEQNSITGTLPPDVGLLTAVTRFNISK